MGDCGRHLAAIGALLAGASLCLSGCFTPPDEREEMHARYRSFLEVSIFEPEERAEARSITRSIERTLLSKDQLVGLVMDLFLSNPSEEKAQALLPLFDRKAAARFQETFEVARHQLAEYPEALQWSPFSYHRLAYLKSSEGLHRTAAVVLKRGRGLGTFFFAFRQEGDSWKIVSFQMDGRDVTLWEAEELLKEWR